MEQTDNKADDPITMGQRQLDKNELSELGDDITEEECPALINRTAEPTQTDQGNFAEFLLIEDENQGFKIQLGSNNQLVSDLCSHALWLKENIFNNKSKKKENKSESYLG